MWLVLLINNHFCFPMAKFVVNHYNSKNPTLQGDSMTTYHSHDATVSIVQNGVLTNGKILMPVNGTVKRYKDGRIEVNGQLIDWEALVSCSRKNQYQVKVLPEAVTGTRILLHELNVSFKELSSDNGMWFYFYCTNEVHTKLTNHGLVLILDNDDIGH